MRGAALLLAVPLATFAGAGPAGADAPFVHEVVHSAGYVGTYCSMALDSEDDPHIVYWDITNQVLVYAVRENGVWSTEVVEATGFVGQHTSIALDAGDVPHVSFVNFSLASNVLRYAVRSGGTWTVETVDPGPADVGLYNAIAVDAAGRPHITYYNATTADLLYAVKNGAWTLETALATNDVGAYTSLALDGQGRPHVAFRNLQFPRLVYGFKDAGTWTFEDVDVPGNPGYWNSLALDAQGQPRISYYDDEDGLQYAARVDDAWIVETVTVDVSQQQTSLALDAGGTPHIAYYDGGLVDDLKYAVRGPAGWMLQTVDATGDVGVYNSIALDSEGNPEIAYHDAANGDLKLTDSGIRLLAPGGGELWPVGATRSVTWRGSGTVDILLSVDGGSSFSVLRENVTDGGAGATTVHQLLVPHRPSRFSVVRIRRDTPFATASSDSFFTIEADVTLLMLSASLLPGNMGARVSWETDPGLEDLAGYILERSPAGGDAWSVVTPLVRETFYDDEHGGPGMRYRLSAVNGLGGNVLLGETALTPVAALQAWPLPYRGGELTVSFLTASGPGGGEATTEVSIFDLRGRPVRLLARGPYPAGHRLVTWDGRDRRGKPVADGLYFLRLATPGASAHLKLLVVR